MPWKELCTMSVREKFVLRASEPGANKAELYREFGISRKTGYKWLQRYEESGLKGLADLSRLPNRSPLKVSGEVVTEIVRLRLAHGWGARKIASVIGFERPDLRQVCPSTVHRVLARVGMLQPVRRRRPRSSNGPTQPPRVEFKQPNDLWTVDFKGWWLSMDKKRCEPLTIRDAHSRFILKIEVLPGTKMEPVRAVFQEVFKTYGLPKAILTDNGPPFVTSQGQLGLTKLSAWWMSLGIEHLRTRPATPSDNGGHERMHRDIANELEKFAAMTRELQQEACERWRHDFNCHRPHEALGMKRPADVYERSRVEYTGAPTDYVYPDGFRVRRINKRGALTHGNRLAFISWALAYEYVGLEELRDGDYAVWYCDTKLGTINFNRLPGKLKPIDWRDVAVTNCHP